MPALEPGPYTVRVELSGFQTVENREVRLVAAGEVTLNVDMKVAGVGEAITVVGRADAIELNKTSPTVGTTVMARQVVELPLSADRNINNLMAVGPNVNRVTGQGTFAANGQRSRNNNYMIDGSDNNDISVTIATTQVVPESVAEFQVQTNAYSVEFGRNSGAQVNVITKSGTNSFRGEFWDYFRTNSLASLTQPREGDQDLTKPADYTRHQAGASIGGPIIKDKTFFFLLYQYDGDDPAASPGTTVRIPTQSGFAALAGVPLRTGQPAASRQAVLDRLSFLNDVYGQNPGFRNLTTTLVNGVPIETGQTNINIVPPSTYHTVQRARRPPADRQRQPDPALLLQQAQGRERDQQLRVRPDLLRQPGPEGHQPGAERDPHLRAQRRERVPLLLGAARPAVPGERSA